MDRTLELRDCIDLTLDSLAECHAELKKSKPGVSFTTDVLIPIRQHDDEKVVVPLEIAIQFLSDADKPNGAAAMAKSPVTPILVSAALCFRSLKAEIRGDIELAWRYLADARYWSGVAHAGRGIDVAHDKTVMLASSEARKENAKSGAQAREKKYEALREYAFELARKPPPGGWRSRSHAVTVITPHVLSRSESDGPKMRGDGVRTIDEWLKAMPDASTWFAKK
ncbi:hypothetical protein [Pandoraea bronchicola]|uniref:Uncharacterized protein n=1 Tax=Pandoraea bronchicola TaxID=2508287 RepID=A0A5E5BZW0_9BURK|nr:hypothetical protein [Pandoraea bronchicola]VVE89880.1 hypothetical protein PBR20603_03853 [Pandoraea bronchicola]